MSVLREAEKCFASQKTYANLNAFITPLQHSRSWLERVKNADARRVGGLQDFTPIHYLFQFGAILTGGIFDRSAKISTGWQADRGER